jgi:hypothetical protein
MGQGMGQGFEARYPNVFAVFVVVALMQRTTNPLVLTWWKFLTVSLAFSAADGMGEM